MTHYNSNYSPEISIKVSDGHKTLTLSSDQIWTRAVTSVGPGTRCQPCHNVTQLVIDRTIFLITTLQIEHVFMSLTKTRCEMYFNRLSIKEEILKSENGFRSCCQLLFGKKVNKINSNSSVTLSHPGSKLEKFLHQQNVSRNSD